MPKSKSRSLKLLAGSAVLMTLAVLAKANETATSGITVVTIIDVVPNIAIARNIEDSSALLAKLALDSQHAAGVTSFKVLQDPTRPNHFVILSAWKDMHSFDAYTGAEVTKHFRQAIQSRLGGPFDERIYNDLQ